METDDAVDDGDISIGDTPDEDDESVDEDDESNFRDPPIGYIRLRPSQFIGIPSTVFIEYPPELGVTRNDASELEEQGTRRLSFKSHWERVCVANAFRRAGFTKSDRWWTALWSKHQNSEQMGYLNCLQKVNHFPTSWCVGRKDRLLRTINAMKRIHGSEYDFHPDGYLLPSERDAFLRQARNDLQANKARSCHGKAGKSIDQSPLWIMKPVASSCGRGIKVVSSLMALSTLPKSRRVIMQRYVDNPYLINGNKFDLRIYVLVTGVDPLRVYIHKEGLTRIATSKYSNKCTNNRFAHLTNYSVNKKSKKFVAASLSGDYSDTEGYKWSLDAFRKWLSKKESPEIATEVFRKINDLCLKTMIAAESDITPNLHSSANFRTNCFELFGCDVILDKNLEPSLLEVNVSPSLVGSSPLDRMIKGILIADILHLVGMYPHDNKLLKQFSRVDEKNTPVTAAANSGRRHNLTSVRADMNSPGHRTPEKPKLSQTSKEFNTNPFAFASVSKMLNSQDKWRKTPTPENVSFENIGNDYATWLMLLMAEDEFDRARATQFNIVHPTKTQAAHYCSLYRINRFSDHLLAKWTMNNGSRGKLKKFIPISFIKPSPENLASSPRASTSLRASSGTSKSQREEGDRGLMADAGATAVVTTSHALVAAPYNGRNGVGILPPRPKSTQPRLTGDMAGLTASAPFSAAAAAAAAVETTAMVENSAVPAFPQSTPTSVPVTPRSTTSTYSDDWPSVTVGFPVEANNMSSFSRQLGSYKSAQPTPSFVSVDDELYQGHKNDDYKYDIDIMTSNSSHNNTNSSRVHNDGYDEISVPVDTTTTTMSYHHHHQLTEPFTAIPSGRHIRSHSVASTRRDSTTSSSSDTPGTSVMKSQSGAEILLHPDHLRHQHQYRGHEADVQLPMNDLISSSQPPLKEDSRRHRGIHREARKRKTGASLTGILMDPSNSPSDLFSPIREKRAEMLQDTELFRARFQSMTMATNASLHAKPRLPRLSSPLTMGKWPPIGMNLS